MKKLSMPVLAVAMALSISACSVHYAPNKLYKEDFCFIRQDDKAVVQLGMTRKEAEQIVGEFYALGNQSKEILVYHNGIRIGYQKYPVERKIEDGKEIVYLDEEQELSEGEQIVAYIDYDGYSVKNIKYETIRGIGIGASKEDIIKLYGDKYICLLYTSRCV